MPTKRPTYFHLRVSDRLRAVVIQRARKARLPLNEWIARVLAEKLGDASLGVIPRLPMGRPPKTD